jgi:glycogen phosphorylase
VAPVVSEARTLDRFIAPAQEKLWELARNVWWSWDHECVSLFRDLNPTRWRELNQNPIALLNEVAAGEIERRATELVLHSRINYAYRRQQEYLNDDRTWGAAMRACCGRGPWGISPPSSACTNRCRSTPAASACWPATTSRAHRTWIFHWSASGLFYGQGYFLQRLDGKRLAARGVSRDDVNQLPMQPAIGANGEPVVVEIATRGSSIRAKVWRVKVGRCDLLLLDSNVAGNAPEDLETTSRLYGGDARTRIRQELLLGVGGFRALKAMGITPGVLHLNEGHSGFAVFEAIRSRMEEEGLDFYSGRAPDSARGDLYHAHAGARGSRPLQSRPDRGAPGTAARATGHLARKPDGIWPRASHRLRRAFCMTVLGLKLARRVNAVSSLHGEVSRAMWRGLYPDGPEDAVPIGHVTNGVHVPSWLAPQMRRLYDRHLGVGWQRESGARTPGRRLRPWTTASCGRRTSA